MGQPWYPGAVKDEMKDSGNWAISTPWRGVLHSTEGNRYQDAKSAYAKGVAPHFTTSFESGSFQCWQHIPLNRAARALMHPAGTVETNRTRCIQIEIVAHAATAGTLQHQYLDGIGKLMRWIEANTEIKRTALKFHGEGEGFVLARDTSPIRLSPQDWLAFNGWCGHQHVPANEHWDPGAIDIDYLLHVDIGVRPMYDPPLPVQIVATKKDRENGGVWVMGDKGEVLAFEGAIYYGGVNGAGFFQGKVPANILYPDEAAAIHPETSWTQYKYVIQSTDGSLYGCPWK